MSQLYKAKVEEGKVTIEKLSLTRKDFLTSQYETEDGTLQLWFDSDIAKELGDTPQEALIKLVLILQEEIEYLGEEFYEC